MHGTYAKVQIIKRLIFSFGLLIYTLSPLYGQCDISDSLVLSSSGYSQPNEYNHQLAIVDSLLNSSTLSSQCLLHLIDMKIDLIIRLDQEDAIIPALDDCLKRLPDNQFIEIGTDIYFKMMHRLAEYHNRHLNIHQVIAISQRSLQYSQYFSASNIESVIGIILNLGIIYLDSNRPDEAIHTFNNAIKLHQLYLNESNQKQFGQINQNLAIAYSMKGDLNNCETHMRKALTIANQNDNLPSEERYKMYLAAADLLYNRYGVDSAYHYKLMAKSLISQDLTPEAISSIYQSLALTHSEIGQIDSAKYYIDKALFQITGSNTQTNQTDNNPLEYLYALDSKVLVYKRAFQKNPTLSNAKQFRFVLLSSLYELSREIADRQHFASDDYIAQMISYMYSDGLDFIHNTTSLIKSNERVNLLLTIFFLYKSMSERLKTTTITSTEQLKNNSEYHSLTQELDSLIRSSLIQNHNLLSEEEVKRTERITQLEKMIFELQRNPENRQTFNEDIDRIVTYIHDHPTSILMIIPTESNAYFFGFNQDSLISNIITTTSKKEQSVIKWRDMLVDDLIEMSYEQPTSLDTLNQLGSELYTDLIQPFEYILDSTVIIYAEGTWNSIPYEGLAMDYSDINYFGSEYAISYVYNLSHIDNRWFAPIRISRYTSFCPHSSEPFIDDSSHQQINLPPLIYSRSESELFGRWLMKSTSWEYSPLSTSKTPTELIHIAAHLMVDTTLPDKSYIPVKLGEPNKLFKLYAEDITSRVTNLQVAFLNTCQSSHTRTFMTRGNFNFLYQLGQSGVQSMVASRYPLDDRQSQDLTNRLIKNLSNGWTLGESFHKMRNDLINSSDPITSRPSYWSGLQLIGNPDLIILTEPRTSRWWIMSIAGLIICSLYFFRKRLMRCKN